MHLWQSTKFSIEKFVSVVSLARGKWMGFLIGILILSYISLFPRLKSSLIIVADAL